MTNIKELLANKVVSVTVEGDLYYITTSDRILQELYVETADMLGKTNERGDYIVYDIRNTDNGGGFYGINLDSATIGETYPNALSALESIVSKYNPEAKKLLEGIVAFDMVKADGSNRRMYGTWNLDIIEQNGGEYDNYLEYIHQDLSDVRRPVKLFDVESKGGRAYAPRRLVTPVDEWTVHATLEDAKSHRVQGESAETAEPITSTDVSNTEISNDGTETLTNDDYVKALNKLRDNVVSLTFYKKDGTKRDMVATLNQTLIQRRLGDKRGQLIEQELEGKNTEPSNYIEVFDTEKLAIRKLNLDTLVVPVEQWGVTQVTDEYLSQWGELNDTELDAREKAIAQYVRGILNKYLKDEGYALKTQKALVASLLNADIQSGGKLYSDHIEGTKELIGEDLQNKIIHLLSEYAELIHDEIKTISITAKDGEMYDKAVLSVGNAKGYSEKSILQLPALTSKGTLVHLKAQSRFNKRNFVGGVVEYAISTLDTLEGKKDGVYNGYTREQEGFEEQLSDLSNNVVRITTIKRNGELTEIWGTRNSGLISKYYTTKPEPKLDEEGKEVQRPSLTPEEMFAKDNVSIFDVKERQWKSYKPSMLAPTGKDGKPNWVLFDINSDAWFRVAVLGETESIYVKNGRYAKDTGVHEPLKVQYEAELQRHIDTGNRTGVFEEDSIINTIRAQREELDGVETIVKATVAEQEYTSEDKARLRDIMEVIKVQTRLRTVRLQSVKALGGNIVNINFGSDGNYYITPYFIVGHLGEVVANRNNIYTRGEREGIFATESGTKELLQSLKSIIEETAATTESISELEAVMGEVGVNSDTVGATATQDIWKDELILLQKVYLQSKWHKINRANLNQSIVKKLLKDTLGKLKEQGHKEEVSNYKGYTFIEVETVGLRLILEKDAPNDLGDVVVFTTPKAEIYLTRFNTQIHFLGDTQYIGILSNMSQKTLDTLVARLDFDITAIEYLKAVYAIVAEIQARKLSKVNKKGATKKVFGKYYSEADVERVKRISYNIAKKEAHYKQLRDEGTYNNHYDVQLQLTESETQNGEKYFTIKSLSDNGEVHVLHFSHAVIIDGKENKYYHYRKLPSTTLKELRESFPQIPSTVPRTLRKELWEILIESVDLRKKISEEELQ